MNVAVTVGPFPRGAGRSFSVPHAVREKCKLFLSQLTGSVCRGMDSLQLTR